MAPDRPWLHDREHEDAALAALKERRALDRAPPRSVNPSMNTDSRRKASADFHAKRKAAGWKKVTVWLPPEALAQLAKLKAAHGSNDGAVQALLNAKPPAADPFEPVRVQAEMSAELGRPPPKPGALLKKR